MGSCRARTLHCELHPALLRGTTSSYAKAHRKVPDSWHPPAGTHSTQVGESTRTMPQLLQLPQEPEKSSQTSPPLPTQWPARYAPSNRRYLLPFPNSQETTTAEEWELHCSQLEHALAAAWDLKCCQQLSEALLTSSCTRSRSGCKLRR